MPLSDLPHYNAWKKYTETHPAVRIIIPDFTLYELNYLHKTHRHLISSRFKKEFNLRITRWVHSYESLSTANPKFGLLYLRTDSDIDPAIEIWAIPGHNAREWRDEDNG